MVDILRTTLVIIVLLFFVTVCYFIGVYLVSGFIKPATLALNEGGSDDLGIPKSQIESSANFVEGAGKKAILIVMGGLLTWFVFLLWYGKEETSVFAGEV